LTHSLPAQEVATAIWDPYPLIKQGATGERALKTHNPSARRVRGEASGILTLS